MFTLLPVGVAVSVRGTYLGLVLSDVCRHHESNAVEDRLDEEGGGTVECTNAARQELGGLHARVDCARE